MNADMILTKLVDQMIAFGNSNLLPWDHRAKAITRDGIPYRPCAWFGPMTSTQRMACTRAMRSLVESGHVERVSDASRERARYLVPTRAGLEWAIKLIGVDVIDMGALRGGLQRVEWVGDLLAALPVEDNELDWAEDFAPSPTSGDCAAFNFTTDSDEVTQTPSQKTKSPGASETRESMPGS